MGSVGTALICAALATISPPISAIAGVSTPAAEIHVYSYESFLADGGPGPALKTAFEEVSPDCRVRYSGYGDGAQLVNRLEIEKQLKADVVVGLDQNTWPRARKFAHVVPAALDDLIKKIPQRLMLGEGFIALDYGAFALMGNFSKDPRLPKEISIKELTQTQWKDRFVLLDPRTSTPGLAFLGFSHEVLGEKEFDSFWRGLREQWLQLSPGWGPAYQLFMRGQVSVVWSYVTSETFHRKRGEWDRRAILFKEGQPLQIEGFAFLKTPSACSLAFGRFLLSDRAQRLIAETHSMMPVMSSVELPEVFKNLPTPKREWVTRMSAPESAALVKRWRQTLAR